MSSNELESTKRPFPSGEEGHSSTVTMASERVSKRAHLDSTSTLQVGTKVESTPSSGPTLPVMDEEEAMNLGVPNSGGNNGGVEGRRYDHDHFAKRREGGKGRDAKDKGGRDREGGRVGRGGKQQWWEKKKQNKKDRKHEGASQGDGGIEEEGAENEKKDSDGWVQSQGKNKEREGGEGEENEANTGDRGVRNGDGEDKKRLPKKKVAVLIGYCGTGYSGMQIQRHEANTIEGDLFAALVKAGAISKDNAIDPRKVDIQRAARTDAGVHAAGNCLSIKLIVDAPVPEGVKSLTEYVNSFLPDQIRMWGFVKTMKSFQARTACDSRVYEYLLPSYCLLPPSSSDPLSKAMDASSPGWRESLGEAAIFADAAPSLPEVKEGEQMDPRARGEYERRRGWRVDQQTLERFRALVQMYKGTHNFHNYTVGKPYEDRSAQRHMFSLTVRDPVVYGDIEWISVLIHGQSFMFHQIRKMMSLAMLACRTGSPPALITDSFGTKRIHIPKAPPLGLLLEQPKFDRYNTRAKHTSHADTREDVDLSVYAEEMHAFKVKWIYERLRQDELETHVFHKWIRQMDCSKGSALSFLNTAGVIPPEAQLARNQQAQEEEDEEAKEKEDAGDGEDS